MHVLSEAVTRLFDLLLAPFGGMHPYWGISAVSAVAGVVLLFLFKYTTDQRKMRAVKDRLKAHFLEVLIYRDSFRILMSAQGNLLAQNARYTALVLPAALALTVPVLLILPQLELRYGHRPLRPGESAILAVRMVDRIPGEEVPVELVAPPGVVVETPMLRIRDEMEADWRLRAEREGRYTLLLRVGQEEVRKELVVAAGQAKVPVRLSRPSFTEELLYPGEGPLPGSSLVQSVRIGYPPYEFPRFPLSGHWLVVFCVVSLLVGFALKPVARVE